MNHVLHRLIQSTPRFVGKNLIVRSLFKKEIKDSTPRKVVGKFGCTYFVPNLVETVSFQLFTDGVYEPGTIDTLMHLLPPNGKFVDIGGNIGSISVPLCKRRPDIKALAVEASPWVFEYLQKNVEVNGLKNLKVLNLALYETDDLELDFYSPKDKFGKGSLASVFTDTAVKVNSVTLDSLLAKNDFEDVDVIKVDVEGFEKTVFSGGSATLAKKTSPSIFFEFVDWAEKSAGFLPGDAQRALRTFGYSLSKRVRGKFKQFEGEVIQGDQDILAKKLS